MVEGLLGKKIGMTQVFDTAGKMIAVTVIEAGPCYALGPGNKQNRIRLGFGQTKESRVSKARAGVFKKANAPSLRFIREVKTAGEEKITEGQEFKVDIFNVGDYVDVIGTSIGKGFQGGVKRWHWRGGSRTHGSTSHRRVGSVGSSAWPSRIWKGHHLPGHMGAQKVTRQNLKVVKVDKENNLLVVNGPVPGNANNLIIVSFAKKKKRAQVAKQ